MTHTASGMPDVGAEFVFMPVFPSMTPFLGDPFVLAFVFVSLVLLLGHHLAFGFWILVAHGWWVVGIPAASFEMAPGGGRPEPGKSMIPDHNPTAPDDFYRNFNGADGG